MKVFLYRLIIVLLAASAVLIIIYTVFPPLMISVSFQTITGAPRDPLDLKKFTLNTVTKTYEFDGKPVIWQYWHGDNIPLYVGLLVEALQCRNPEFRTIIVQDSTVYKYLPDFKVPKRLYDILISPHKADLFRVAALAKYGGIYADVDVFALEKFYPLYQLLANYDVITPKWYDEIFALGQIGPARAGLRIFELWHRNQLNAIRKKVDIDEPSSNSSINDTLDRKPFPKSDPFAWGELLLNCTKGLETEVLNQTKYRGYNGRDTVGQLVKKGLQESATASFDRASPKFLPLKWAPVLFLHHRKLKEAYTKVTELEVLFPAGKATLYSAFVGCALMDCRSDFEKLAAENETAVTPVAKANVADLLKALGRLDPSICMKLNQSRNYESFV